MPWHKHSPERRAQVDALVDAQLLAWWEWLTRPEVQASCVFWDAAAGCWSSFRTRAARRRFWEILVQIQLRVIEAHALRRVYVSDLFLTSVDSGAITGLMERKKRTR